MPTLLYNNGQVHVLVNGAIQVEGACGIKGANGTAITAIERFVDGRRTAFNRRFGSAIDPTAIYDDVGGWGIVNQIEHVSFMQGD